MNNLNSLLNEIVSLTKEQEEQLYIYYNALIESSKVMNLTTITKLDEVYIKHFYDSMMTLNPFLTTDTKNNLANIKLLDIGSGAGFPGLVLKIVYPALDITLLEPTKKRCDFLEKVIKVLELEKIKVVNERAENYIQDQRETYDLVVARAVSKINIISELATPYLKVGGYFLALKGQNYQEECKNIDQVLNKLSCKVEKYFEYELPLEMGQRVIIQIKKQKKTLSIYPRSYAKIKSKPLE